MPPREHDPCDTPPGDHLLKLPHIDRTIYKVALEEESKGKRKVKVKIENAVVLVVTVEKKGKEKTNWKKEKRTE